MGLNFLNYSDLVADVCEWLPKLPQYDLIVGIERSGIIPAAMIALYRNVPFQTVNEFIRGSEPQQGPRGQVLPTLQTNRALVVDDTRFTGSQMANVWKQIRYKHRGWDIHYAAVYDAGFVQTTEPVVATFKVIPQPRCFQWNVFHHDPIVPNSCMDIDGVLCRKPTEEENDDGPKYEKFLADTPPLFTPTIPIGCLVTSRLEKYRKQTETWLAKHHVQYKKLLMLDCESKKERIRRSLHGLNKIAEYSNNGYVLMFEDEQAQAEEICKKTGKPVLWVNPEGNWVMYERAAR